MNKADRTPSEEVKFDDTCQEIKDFFHDKAFAYSKGQLRYLSLLFLRPCRFIMGSEMLKAGTHQDVENVFETYRNNLLEQDYDKTSAEVVHIADAPDGTTHCLVTYTNTSLCGAVISTEHANYVMHRTDEGFLRIGMVEFVDNPKPRFLKGTETLFSTCGSLL